MLRTSTFILACASTLTFNAVHAQGTWTQLNNVGGQGRYWATGFATGDVVYIGCGYTGSAYLQDFWAYNISTGTWTQRANYPGDGRLYTSAFSIGDKGYFFGGNYTGFSNDLWEYDPASNTWTEKASLPATGRWGAAGFSIGTKGYIGTGDNLGGNGQGCQSDFWEWDQATNTWTQRASFPGTPVYATASFSIGNKGYIGTGADGSSAHDEFFEWDQATNTWTQKADVPGGPRYQAFGFSIGTRGFIGGGSTGDNDLWAWDQATDTWTQATSFPGTGLNVSTGVSLNGKGYVAGGAPANTQFWEFEPACPSVAAPIDPAGPVAVCDADSVTLTAPTGITYLWSDGRTSASIDVTDAGSYSVTITDGQGCELTTEAVEVSVTPLPPTPTITVGDASLLCNATADAYQWLDCNNGLLPIPGATESTYAPGVDGFVAVRITVDGCSSISDCADLLSTGLSQVDAASVKVQPNPFVDALFINVPDDARRYSVTVIDALGREVQASTDLHDKQIRVQVDDVSGVLFIRLANAEGMMGSWRVVKQ